MVVQRTQGRGLRLPANTHTHTHAHTNNLLLRQTRALKFGNWSCSLLGFDPGLGHSLSFSVQCAMSVGEHCIVLVCM